MKQKIKLLWETMRRPSTHISLGVLTLGGFIAGILFWGGFNTALEATNTETFCISCHEMQDNVYAELQQTVHWANRTGVRATCPDCHVPHNWTNKVARKVQASKEVWGTIFGTINTREKFLEKRLTLAQHEWARFSANGSLECRNCHDYDSMDFDAMSEKGRIQMRKAAEQDQSCISCHKGIAHELPDLMAASSEALAKLEQQASGVSYDEDEMYYTVRQIPAYLDPELQNEAGHFNPATPVKLVATKGDNLQVEVSAWRKTKGFGRVLNEDFGFNISSAILSKESAQDKELIQATESKVDDLTGLKWEKVSLKLWIKPGVVMDSMEPIWGFAKETYDKSCSVCHTQPDENHFDANSWPGQFNGMLSFVNLDGETQSLVLKYLQKHSSDFAESSH